MGGSGAVGGSVGGSGGVGGVGGVGGSGAIGGYYCFEAGSEVATPHGSVAIERLSIGDEVLAFDERTGAIAKRRVLRTYVHETTRTGVLALRDGRTLHVTPEHPIFRAGTQRFEPAETIGAGDELVTLPFSLGPTALLDSKTLAASRSVLVPAASYAARALDEPVTVYNLHVDELETYFVEGVLVHNKSTGGYVNYGGGGFGGSSIGGDGGTAGGCLPSYPETWLLEPCPVLDECIDPLSPTDEIIPLNRQVVVPEDDDGAGGQAGETGAFPPEYGFTSAGIQLCNPPADGYPHDEYFTLAYDVYQPRLGAPIHTFSTAVDQCLGETIGDVVLTDFDVPPAETWTTQCIRIWGHELSRQGFHLSSSEQGVRFANPRFVTDCACTRELKRWSTCGYDANGHGGGSACE